jgi:hypothetical protein
MLRSRLKRRSDFHLLNPSALRRQDAQDWGVLATSRAKAGGVFAPRLVLDRMPWVDDPRH